MKSINELLEVTRLAIMEYSKDGGYAWANLLSSKKAIQAAIIFSWSGGWDHVSVSFRDRTPTWDEMNEVKRMFFREDEVCYQLHPAEAEYVNSHPHCLHIWRPQTETIPMPPSWMIGPRKGQSLADAIKEGEAALGISRIAHSEEPA